MVERRLLSACTMIFKHLLQVKKRENPLSQATPCVTMEKNSMAPMLTRAVCVQTVKNRVSDGLILHATISLRVKFQKSSSLDQMISDMKSALRSL